MSASMVYIEIVYPHVSTDEFDLPVGHLCKSRFSAKTRFDRVAV